MTDHSELYKRVHTLLAARMHGEPDPAADQELAHLLGQSEAARRAYALYVSDTVDLAWCSGQPQALELADSIPATPSPVTARSVITRSRPLRVIARLPSLRVNYSLAAAACVVVALVGYAFWAAGDGQPARPPHGPATGVATLVRSRDAQWRPRHPAPAEFARLKVGNRLEIDSGQIELLFDTGVEVVVRGPSSLEVSSPNSITAEQGAITARVGESGQGFVVETPTTKLTDLGTEFGVDIRKDGTVDVAVFHGMVDLSHENAQDDEVERLFQGDAVRVSGAGMTTRLLAFDNNKFPVVGDSGIQARRQPIIISQVRDNIQDGRIKKAYRIVRSGFWEDSLAFVDRFHEWNGIDEGGIPEELLGGEYVMPFNDDKFFDHLQVSIDIARPATIYILISDTVSLPEWLIEEFEDTGLDVGLDEGPFEYEPRQTTSTGPGNSIDTRFSVWKREVREPSTLTLGGVTRHPETVEGYNMYGIVAQPL